MFPGVAPIAMRMPNSRTLRSTEELLELLKEKPNRVVWGTPTPAEQRAAKDKVEAARKAQGAKP